MGKSEFEIEYVFLGDFFFNDDGWLIWLWWQPSIVSMSLCGDFLVLWGLTNFQLLGGERFEFGIKLRSSTMHK